MDAIEENVAKRQKIQECEGAKDIAEPCLAEADVAEIISTLSARLPDASDAGSKVAAVAFILDGKPCAPDASDTDFDLWTKGVLAKFAQDRAGITPEEEAKCSDKFDDYKFTGSLRPAHVTKQMQPPGGCTLPDYALHSGGVARSESLRKNRRTIPVMEGEKLDKMRRACTLGREVLDIAGRYLKPGVTGNDIDCLVWQASAERNCYPSPLNYFLFPKSVCVSANEIICHGIPDCRPMQKGDIINLDVSVYHEGLHADLNETFFIGDCDEDSHRLVKAAYESLRKASEMIKPGTLYRDLGNAIHNEAVSHGTVVVPNFCGHGVGELFHGPPDVPHYRKNKAVGIMRAGHIFTVEPMVNLGKERMNSTWPDKWTEATRSGERSAQFEHTFLVTADGFEVLTARPGAELNSMPAYDASVFQR